MGEAAPVVAGTPTEQPRAGVSGWAIGALGTSLALCCPLLTIVGPLMALRALVEIRANPLRTGRGLAIAAIWIGCIACIGWIVLLIWWNTHVRGALLRGPDQALRAGLAGDVAGFRSSFIGDGAATDDVRVQLFLSELVDRFGAFRSAAQDPGAPAPTQSGGRDILIPYAMTFEQGGVKAEVHWLLFAKGLAPRMQSIRVKDAERGDLTFP